MGLGFGMLILWAHVKALREKVEWDRYVHENRFVVMKKTTGGNI